MAELQSPAIRSKSDSQTQIAYQRLQRLIIDLELPPGEVVSEKQLATALVIGRTPVREALRELAREGLVTILPQRGIIISEIDLSKQLRLIELNRILLGFIVNQAARRASPVHREQLAASARDVEANGVELEKGALLISVEEATVALVGAARNDFAAAAFRLSDGLDRRFTFAYFQEEDALRQLGAAVVEILTAVAEANDAVAAAALDRLCDQKAAIARRALEAA